MQARTHAPVRHHALLAHQVFVALVVGVDSDGRVAEDGLRTGRGHRKKLAAVAFHWVLEKVQKTVLVRILHLRAATAQERIQFLAATILALMP